MAKLCLPLGFVLAVMISADADNCFGGDCKAFGASSMLQSKASKAATAKNHYAEDVRPPANSPLVAKGMDHAMREQRLDGSDQIFATDEHDSFMDARGHYEKRNASASMAVASLLEDSTAKSKKASYGGRRQQACLDLSGVYCTGCSGTGCSGTGCSSTTLSQTGCSGTSDGGWSYTVDGSTVTIDIVPPITGTVTGMSGSYTIVMSNGLTYNTCSGCGPTAPTTAPRREGDGGGGGTVCGSITNVNDFSSIAAMKASGWTFTNCGDKCYKPESYKGFAQQVPKESYWGFAYPGALEIELTLQGSGQVTVDFGNQCNSGSVDLFLDGLRKGTAGPAQHSLALTTSQTETASFNDGDVLKLGEYNTAVLVLNVVSFHCQTTAPSTGPACGSITNVNDFSSKAAMKAAGWTFTKSGGPNYYQSTFVFKPPKFRKGAPTDSYWGFAWPGVLEIELTLLGSGQVTVDFGNSFPDGHVDLFLHGSKRGTAKQTLSTTQAASFNDGDVLKLGEYKGAVIVLNSVSFNC